MVYPPASGGLIQIGIKEGQLLIMDTKKNYFVAESPGTGNVQ